METPTTAVGPESASDQRIELAGPDTSFFTRNNQQRPEIISGLLREGQLAAFAGPYGVGKSPLLADIAVHTINGKAWCGRQVSQRTVVHFDHESAGPAYRRNIRNVACRLEVQLPRVPHELECYVEHDSMSEPATARLLTLLEAEDFEVRLEFIKGILTTKPNALVIIDPLELLFRIDTKRKLDVLSLYAKLRRLLSEFPQAAVITTFNLRKRDKRAGKADLLSDPRDWLEEVCGTLDVLNRSDVRLGMDFYAGENENIRVLNGVRRAEDMHPMVISSVGEPPDGLSGFELCPTNELRLNSVLTAKQRDYWTMLPEEFRFEEVAGNLVPRSSLSRLLDRARSLGIVRPDGNVWKKMK